MTKVSSGPTVIVSFYVITFIVLFEYSVAFVGKSARGVTYRNSGIGSNSDYRPPVREIYIVVQIMKIESPIKHH